MLQVNRCNYCSLYGATNDNTESPWMLAKEVLRQASNVHHGQARE